MGLPDRALMRVGRAPCLSCPVTGHLVSGVADPPLMILTPRRQATYDFKSARGGQRCYYVLLFRGYLTGKAKVASLRDAVGYGL